MVGGHAQAVAGWRKWSLQEPHKELGLRAAEKCTSMRLEGCEDMGSLVMGVAADLIEFDFSDTFVNAFEVANKCSEILMMREASRFAASTRMTFRGRPGTRRWWPMGRSRG